MKTHPLLLLIPVSFCLVFTNCKKTVESTVQDVDQTAALKNVTFTYDHTTYNLTLPEGATSGKSFEDLVKEDSAAFTNPEHYAVAFTVYIQAENKKSDASDAKFDGMTTDIVMDNLTSTPVRTTTGAFMIAKDATAPVVTAGNISLKTHKPVVLYIFRQIVASADLVATFSSTANYKFGPVTGTIPLPSFQKNIPTNADANTKAFLQGLLNSGVFN